MLGEDHEGYHEWEAHESLGRATEWKCSIAGCRALKTTFDRMHPDVVDATIYDGECATCDHAVVQQGADYQCDEGCRCTMRGCVLYVGHPLQVEARLRRIAVPSERVGSVGDTR